MADFKDMKRLSDLNPSHRLAHLIQAVPEEAKRLLYQQQVDTVEHCLEILTDLYEPIKDSSSFMQEILNIIQQPRWFRVIAGWTEDTARKYADALEFPSTCIEKLMKSQFKQAISNDETMNQLLWD